MREDLFECRKLGRSFDPCQNVVTVVLFASQLVNGHFPKSKLHEGSHQKATTQALAWLLGDSYLVPHMGLSNAKLFFWH